MRDPRGGRREEAGMTAQLSTLSNGLRIATDRLDTVDTVALGLWIDVGTRHEPAEINGVAHFLEHMAFKGTERRSAAVIAEEIEAVGGHLNAYTSRESTAYYAKVLKEDVPLALDILADILQHSIFDPAELERERTVILQEIGQANDTPDDIVFDHFQECAYPNQPMGRPVLGSPEIIRRIRREQIVGYLRDHYAAGRMVLAAAGNLDHDRLAGLAERLLSGLPRERPVATEPARYAGGERRIARELEQLHLVLGFPGLVLGDPDYYAASVLSTAFGGGMSSRLFQEIREKRGLVYAVHSFAHAYRDSGLFGIYAGTGEDEAAELMPVLCHEVVRLAEGLTPVELARAKTQMKAGLLMSLESTSARCEQMAQHMLIHGTPFDPPEIVQKIEEVDDTAIARVVARWRSGPPTLTALGPLGRLEDFDRLRARLGT
jgi:predicted Zn-dependent peptidase